MGRLRAKPDHKQHRKARIVENQAKLAYFGVQKIVSELKSITSSIKPEKREYCKVDYSSGPRRRSRRLTGNELFEDNDSEDAGRMGLRMHLR